MYRIGQAAKQTGISPETLRYYDAEELVRPSSRSNAGYRLYTEQDLQQLHFINSAKQMGFSLNDIKKLLALELDKNNKSCEDVKSFTEIKLNELGDRISRMQTMYIALKSIHDSCCGGQEAASHCTILQALASAKSQNEPEPQTLVGAAK
jgi:MerR family transcriptional regulator, Zn(II)-responsive regulator of zntA